MTWRGTPGSGLLGATIGGRHNRYATELAKNPDRAGGGERIVRGNWKVRHLQNLVFGHRVERSRKPFMVTEQIYL